MFDCAPVWVFSDPNAINEVLLCPEDFRIAERSEHVPNKSRSFFLSADVLGWDRGKELKKILAQFFGREGVDTLRSNIVQAVESVDGFDGKDVSVDMACRRALCAVLGISEFQSQYIEAHFRIAKNQADMIVGEVALILVRKQVELLLDQAIIGENTFISWIKGRADVTQNERVMLLIPFFEMLALGQHAALSQAALKAPSASIAEKVRYATTQLDGIILTRVALLSRMVAGQMVAAGDRILLDVTASNTKTPVPESCFGKGEHRCIGQLLAVEIATAVVKRAVNVS